jgi:hypothetical protein
VKGIIFGGVVGTIAGCVAAYGLWLIAWALGLMPGFCFYWGGC